MKPHRVRPFFASRRLRAPGFTLIELMVVCAIAAVLAAIAIPNYADYVTRGKITDATTGLADFNQRYQQYFNDARTYVGACAIYKPIINSNLQTFQVDCPTETTSTYVITATGVAAHGMGGFSYTLDNTGSKSSAGPGAWGSAASCWLIRKGGGCT